MLHAGAKHEWRLFMAICSITGDSAACPLLSAASRTDVTIKAAFPIFDRLPTFISNRPLCLHFRPPYTDRIGGLPVSIKAGTRGSGAR